MDGTPVANLAFLGVVLSVVIAGATATERTAPAEERRRVRLRALSFGALWLLLTALPTVSGLLAPDGRLPPQAFMGAVLLAAVAFALSRLGGAIARSTPLAALVGFQGFRLPLELVLHRWVSAGVAPPQMTWTGQNPDIVSGLLALAAVPLISRSRVFAWVPTVVGILLLVNILRIVATSLPGPLQRFPDPVTLPFRFPHVWIGSVCVAGALAGHLITLRALRAR
ncbi:MAG: hypothetical protein R3E10_06890 [Gemmatimonadota bacterium]